MTDSFIEALTDLSPGDGKRVAAFLDKLVHAPDAAGLRPEIVHDAGDRTIRSLKVTHDLRAIGHIDSDEIVLLYVGQHDEAYAWASKRCIECHPVTGEMQIVEDPAEAEQRLASHGAVTHASRIAGGQAPAAGLFSGFTDDYLLSLGVPPSWLPTVRMIYNDDMLLSVAPDLPTVVSDRLVRLATGEFVGPGGVAPPLAADAPAGQPTEDRYRVCTVVDGETLCELLSEVGLDRLAGA